MKGNSESVTGLHQEIPRKLELANGSRLANEIARGMRLEESMNALLDRIVMPGRFQLRFDRPCFGEYAIWHYLLDRRGSRLAFGLKHALGRLDRIGAYISATKRCGTIWQLISSFIALKNYRLVESLDNLDDLAFASFLPLDAPPTAGDCMILMGFEKTEDARRAFVTSSAGPLAGSAGLRCVSEIDFKTCTQLLERRFTEHRISELYLRSISVGLHVKTADSGNYGGKYEMTVDKIDDGGFSLAGTVAIELGSFELPLEQLLNLRHGMTLEVALPPDFTVKLLLGGVGWATAKAQLEGHTLKLTLDDFAGP